MATKSQNKRMNSPNHLEDSASTHEVEDDSSSLDDQSTSSHSSPSSPSSSPPPPVTPEGAQSGTSKNSSKPHYPRTGKRGAPQAFAHKLYQILSEGNDAVISWNEKGTAFAIHDLDSFVHSTLHKFFRHRKFSSFQRQLNLYGFKKMTKGEDAGYYYHTHFRRGRLDLLTSVRRQSTTQNARSPGSTPPPSSHSPVLDPTGGEASTPAAAPFPERMPSLPMHMYMTPAAAVYAPRLPFAYPHLSMPPHFAMASPYMRVSDQFGAPPPMMAPHHMTLVSPPPLWAHPHMQQLKRGYVPSDSWVEHSAKRPKSEHIGSVESAIPAVYRSHSAMHPFAVMHLQKSE